jgi:hypothetical protein
MYLCHHKVVHQKSAKPIGMSRQSVSHRIDIKNPAEFSIAFAVAVTESSDNPDDWIAKKGNESIFALLYEVFPQARVR